MSLLQPEALLLLLLVAAGAAIGMRLRPGPGVATRALLLSLLVIAMSRPVLWVSHPQQTVVYLLDRSDSIPPAERARAQAAATAQAAQLPDDTHHHLRFFGASVWMDGETGPTHQTRLSQAIAAGLQLIPTDHDGELVVFTDGRFSDAPLDAVLAAAAERGVAIRAEPLDPSLTPPRPGMLTLPASAAPGETITVTVLLHGGEDGHDGPMTVSHLDRVLLEEDIQLDARERREVNLTVPLPPSMETGLAALTVNLGAASTTGHLRVSRPPAVLLVGDRDGDTAPLESLLVAEGMQVDTTAPGAVPSALGMYDVIILADTPIKPPVARGQTLPEGFVAALDDYVQGGGGLLVLGGERSYDLGGWEDSPLEDLLPVRLDPDGAIKDDAVTLVIAMDKSGSMARPAVPVTYATGLGSTVSAQISGGRPVGSKIRLADEGAIAALALLREKDQLGVLTIDSVARWVVPVQPLQQRDAIEERILQIGAGGGGINLMTALEATYTALEDADTPIRHAILFADSSGISERRRRERTALEMVEQYRRAEITLSVVGIGGPASRDADYLADLAERGGGKLYLTADARELPALFTQETERLMGAGLEEEAPIRAQQAQWHPALSAVDIRRSPTLRGYNPVLPRERTRILLTTVDDRPLLALWRRGLGEVAAVSTDAGARWAGRWLRWDGYARLWTQLVRHLAAPDQSEGATLTVQEVPGGAQARLMLRRPDGLSEDTTGLTFTGQAQGASPIPLTPVVPEPGVWEVRWDSPPATLWTLTVADQRGVQVAGTTWAAPASPEGLWQTADGDVLQQLQQAGRQNSRARERIDLIPWLLGLLVLLLPLDALARGRKKIGAGD